ncbi:T-complex protein 1 subunit eta [Dictyocoela muelleri]|nr:T-complex protein 1 subunit eta [Dictyocoela muelleri]
MQIVTHEQLDTRTGINQLISNINAWTTISDIISTTLGPYGRDKMFVTGSSLLITNDGATILKNLSINHPAGLLLLKISESQDKSVGDGTTSVVILAVEILNQLKPFINEKFCLKTIISCVQQIKELVDHELAKISFNVSDAELEKIAMTCMSSKILSSDKKKFSQMLIKAVKGIESIKDLGIKKVKGCGFDESFLVDGVAFEKCFTYAGYEQQPKRIENAKILCLNVELEWKSERENAEVNVNVDEYQAMVDAEWTIIKEKLDKIVESGAKVILSCLPIGDYATQYFARYGIFCAGRVSRDDLKRITRSCGGVIYSSVSNIECLGVTCLFEEKQVGNLRYNFFQSEKAYTLILRGPTEEVINEVERSINDATNVIFHTLKKPRAVIGAGSIEMEISKAIRVSAKSLNDKRSFIYMAIGQAFEIIPFNLSKNFGLDPINSIQKLRRDHCEEKMSGVTVNGIYDVSDILEPLIVKKNLYQVALNAVISLLRVDSTFVADKPAQ